MGCQTLPDPEGGRGDGFAFALYNLPQPSQRQQLLKALVLLPADQSLQFDAQVVEQRTQHIQNGRADACCLSSVLLP